MTTSSSDSSRCTRISPSAVLDDRLDGKDLEWARDHLRRCETCRDRVEDFREMLLRVGRLPKAVVGAAAMDQAFVVAIPERLRDERGSRSFETVVADQGRLMPSLAEPPAPMYPEVTSIPDLMSDLEREIFHDEPVQDHPTALSPPPPTPAIEADPVEEDSLDHWREVPIDSHREPDREAPPLMPEPEPVVEPEPIAWVREPEPEPQPEPASATAEAIPEAESLPVLWEEPEPEPATAVAAGNAVDSAGRGNVIFDHEPALTFADAEEVTPARPPRKSDTGMRLAVGLGAAACVLLAAVLYEGGTFLKLGHNLSATAPTASASVHASARSTTKATVSASATAPATATAPPATVLYTFGDGVVGGSVFRIRPGTAVAGYTRLVFDIHGSGLPSMIVTRPDDSHIQVFFKNTTVTGVPVSGIRSYHVAAVEPGVQQGADGSFLIDLAHPVRVTAFTLPATGGYAWRLVVDLHTS